MIVEFRLGNYKSYRNIRKFTMVATSDVTHFEDNVATVTISHGQKDRTINVLKSAVIYGANASGKSNLLIAVKFMKEFVFKSSKDMQIDEMIPVEPCIVAEGSQDEPSHFEIIFFDEGVRYRYGFEVTKAAVTSEWLFFSPKGKEARLFVREKGKYDIGPYFREGKGLPEKTRDNALFLSVCAQFNGKISTIILNWFKNLNVISGIEDKDYLQFTLSKLNDKDFLENIKKFIRYADLGIEDISFEDRDVDLSELPDAIRTLPDTIRTKIFQEIEKRGEEAVRAILRQFRFTHAKFNGHNRTGPVAFEQHQESQGTQKLFAIAGPILDTLKLGKTLFIDELDTRLHPLLTQYLIRLFNSRKSNTNNAQLIFATHDTNLLSSRFFRRDQIWFAEKDNLSTTDLYSLSDFKVRKDATFNKDYIMGKYGAIPYISYNSFIFGEGGE